MHLVITWRVGIVNVCSGWRRVTEDIVRERTMKILDFQKLRPLWKIRTEISRELPADSSSSKRSFPRGATTTKIHRIAEKIQR
jgi:hypothetical protein